MPRFEASQTDPIPRPSLLICTEQQFAFVMRFKYLFWMVFRSVLRGYGSLDFRLLLFEYIKKEPNRDLFIRVEQEFNMLSDLFKSK